MNKEFIKAGQIIDQKKFFCITFHRNPDGDALGNALLWAWILKQKGKAYRILSCEPVPDRYRFLTRKYMDLVIPEFLEIPDGTSLSSRLPEGIKDFTAVILDSSSPSRIGHFSGQIMDARQVINIDHHGDNLKFGTVNCVDSSAASSAEITWDLMRALKIPRNRTIAEIFYIALAADTGIFSQKNVTPKTVKLLQEILSLGVNISELNAEMKKKSFSLSKLIGCVLERMEEAPGGIIHSYIRSGDLKRLSVSPQDTDDVIDQMTVIRNSKVIVLFKEYSKRSVKVSLRSNSDLNVQVIARSFGGGGHVKAAGFEMECSLKECIQTVLDRIGKTLQ